MADKIKLSAIREQFPMYKDVSDTDLLIGLHKKYYNDIPGNQFYNQIDYDTQKLNPAEGMSAFDKFMTGAGARADSAWEGIKGLIPGVAPESARSKDDRAAYERNSEQLGNWGKAGELGADIALTAMPATKVMQGANKVLGAVPKLGGALTKFGLLPAAIGGGATAAALDPEDRSGAALGGALGGAIGEGAGRAVTKTLGGLFRGKNISQDAADLLKSGVDVPLWKTSDSGLLRGMVERMKVWPVAGDILRSAEGKAMRDVELNLMNKANPSQYNGSAWVEGKPIKTGGEEGIGQLHQNFNNAYDTLYKGRSVPIDAQYGKTMADILRDTKGYFPGYAEEIGAAGRQIDDLLRSGTESTFSKSPVLDATGMPFVNEQLGHAAASTNNVKMALDSVRSRIETAVRTGQMDKVDILKKMEAEILDLRNRGLPQEMAGVGKDVDRAYATYKQLQRANTAIGSKTAGHSTPSQLLNAIKANDRTPGKSAFAEGNALNQDFVQKAKNVLGDRLPDAGPGTAEKLMMLGGLGLPFLGQDYAVATPAALLLATKTGRRALTGSLRGQAGIRNIGDQYLTPALRSYGVADSMEK